MMRGQPFAMAARAWRLMFGYFAELNRSSWTVVGRRHPAVVVAAGGGEDAGGAMLLPGFAHGHGKLSQ